MGKHLFIFRLIQLRNVSFCNKQAVIVLLLKNRVCYALREDFHLEEGEYFIADLVGLPVLDAENGKEYGRVKELINRGASDIYVVETPNGETMIPAVPAFVSRVDVSVGVFVTPIDGMFASEDV